MTLPDTNPGYTPLDPERLRLLERLVAVHTEAGEWETFVALLRRAGLEITPAGVREVRK